MPAKKVRLVFPKHIVSALQRTPRKYSQLNSWLFLCYTPINISKITVNMTFTSDRQPDPEDRVPRGKSKKNMILDAIKLETGDDGVEFLRKVIRIGLGTNDNPPVPTILSEAIKRIQPPIKPVMECVNLDISKCKSDAEKAVKVLSAVAKGEIAPDVGQLIIGMIKDSILITESTELLERLEALEKAIEAANQK